MLVKIIETGKIEEIKYHYNGIDCALDIALNSQEFDILENNVVVMKQEAFDWWKKYTEQMTEIDETIEQLADKYDLNKLEIRDRIDRDILYYDMDDHYKIRKNAILDWLKQEVES